MILYPFRTEYVFEVINSRGERIPILVRPLFPQWNLSRVLVYQFHFGYRFTTPDNQEVQWLGGDRFIVVSTNEILFLKRDSSKLHRKNLLNIICNKISKFLPLSKK